MDVGIKFNILPVTERKTYSFQQVVFRFNGLGSKKYCRFLVHGKKVLSLGRFKLIHEHRFQGSQSCHKKQSYVYNSRYCMQPITPRRRTEQ